MSVLTKITHMDSNQGTSTALYTMVVSEFGHQNPNALMYIVSSPAQPGICVSFSKKHGRRRDTRYTEESFFGFITTMKEREFQLFPLEAQGDLCEKRFPSPQAAGRQEEHSPGDPLQSPTETSW